MLTSNVLTIKVLISNVLISNVLISNVLISNVFTSKVMTKLGSLRKVGERRQDKAKIGEKAEFTGVNEHFEPMFNAVLPSAGSFRTKPSTSQLSR